MLIPRLYPGRNRNNNPSARGSYSTAINAGVKMARTRKSIKSEIELQANMNRSGCPFYTRIRQGELNH